ncbi:MAG: glycosyltransferase family 2 protein [Magnetococcus sp. DMHC-6]
MPTKKKSLPKGYIDHLSTEIISGWVAIQDSDERLEIELLIDDIAVTSTKADLYRQDLQEAGIGDGKHGFQMLFPQILLDGQEHHLVVREISSGHCFVNETRVLGHPSEESISLQNQLMEQEKLLVNAHQTEKNFNNDILSKPRGYIDRMKNFVLQGWAVDGDGHPAQLQLCIDDETIECYTLRSHRQDVISTLNIENAKVGFDIYLPGYIWENHDKPNLDIQVLANGMPILKKPLQLTRRMAKEWVINIVRQPEEPQKQFFALLALEHIRYATFLSELPAKEANWMGAFIGRINLGDFLITNKIQQYEKQIPLITVSTQLVWKSLWALNSRIIDKSQSVFDHVVSVIQEMRLQGDTKDWFLITIVPLLCQTESFLRLRELTNFVALQRLCQEQNVCDLSLKTAFLVADGQINTAADLIYRIAEIIGTKKDMSWLCTSSLNFSLKIVQRMDASGELEFKLAEKFRYALIYMLDAYKGDWFSRLHDTHFIQLLLNMLSAYDQYTDYHREDIVLAGLRIYGLNPTFWAGVLQQNLLGVDQELTFGYAQWQQIHKLTTEKSISLLDWVEKCAEPLAYFQSKNNAEVALFLREISMTLLPHLNETLLPSGTMLLNKLLALNPSESLRMAAFPLVKENLLLEHFPQTQPKKLRLQLRNLSKQGHSMVLNIQEQASQALQNLLVATNAGQGQQSLHTACRQIETHALQLAHDPGGFLAFDLLASGYLLHDSSQPEGSAILLRMMMILQKIQTTLKEVPYLPAPVMAGLLQLEQMEGKSSMLRSFLSECRFLLLNTFGAHLETLLTPPKSPKLTCGTTGWPQDTLVVIYSCRKYLESRVQQIRATWVQDLIARGIPYLVLVGDGDDTLQGDVLALNVSDHYEYLPQKSLKLFEWVYHHTNAQYLLKIDDDCHLNVEYFFNTLSYRKHHYYGRIIVRSLGSMDRAWHQKKSHTILSQKSIDKSPEPSIYADGGCGYVLSRLALFNLLEVVQTDAGEKLVHQSFMEDKLVGDLLALVKIKPSDEDYVTYLRRRTFAQALPVAMWDNVFYPCQSTLTKVSHLDSELDMAPTQAKMASQELWPKKIWPTCDAPNLNMYDSSQLELLIDPSALANLLQNRFFVISVVRNERIMLPHFLSHYRLLGVKCFVFVDNCSDDGSREYLREQSDVILFSTDTEYKKSHFGVTWQQAVLGNFCVGKWVLLADADELLVYEGSDEGLSIEHLITKIEAQGCDAACQIMVDMYPEGDLSTADFTKEDPFTVASWFDQQMVTPWRLGSGSYSNSPSYVSHLRHRVIERSIPHDFVSQKFALFRYAPWIRLSEGVHYASNLKVYKPFTWFAHFKYHAGFKQKVEIEINRGQHFNNAAEYNRYAVMLAEGKGCFAQEGVSVKYEGGKTFAMLMDQNSEFIHHG